MEICRTESPKNITIKMADLNEKTDLDDLWELEPQIFNQPYHLAFSSPEELKSGFWDSEVYIFYDGDKPVGELVYRRSDEPLRYKQVELEGIGVIPEYRGTGLSQEIMDFFFSQCPDSHVYLVTAPENPVAIRFYERNGFRKQGEGTGFQGASRRPVGRYRARYYVRVP